MSGEFLFGVPGKMKTLLDRLTADRAARLDADISSRLSTSDYGSTTSNVNSIKSDVDAYLDAKISEIGGLYVTDPLDMLASLVSAMHGAIVKSGVNTDYNSSEANFYTLMARVGASHQCTVANTYQDLVDITARGKLYTVISPYDTPGIRITVDGGTPVEFDTISTTKRIALGGYIYGEPETSGSGYHDLSFGGYADRGFYNVDKIDYMLTLTDIYIPNPAALEAMGFRPLRFEASLKIEIKCDINSGYGDYGACVYLIDAGS